MNLTDLDYRIAHAKEQIDLRYEDGYTDLADHVFYSIIKENDIPIDQDVLQYLKNDVMSKPFCKNKKWNSVKYLNDFTSVNDKEKFVKRGLIDHTLYDGDFNEARKQIIEDIWDKETKEETLLDSNKAQVKHILTEKVVPGLFKTYLFSHLEKMQVENDAMDEILEVGYKIYTEDAKEFTEELYADMHLLYKLDKEKHKLDKRTYSRQPIIEEIDTPIKEPTYSASKERAF